MKTIRTGLMSLAVLAVSLVFQQPAQADVRVLRPVQTLPKPTNPSWQHFGLAVAIDGPHIIVLAINEGTPAHTYAALLYRRNSSDGRWVFRRTLMTATGAFARMDVRMKSGIAVVNFGGQVSLFENVGGDYVPARTAAPIRHPGSVDVSADSVLIGGDNCDYDAVVYKKSADGVWRISGRLDDNAGECDPAGVIVELNFDYALLRSQYGNVAHAWRRNGTAIDWVPAGVLTMPPDMGVSERPYTLQGATAVANNGLVYLRTGTSTWTLQGKATSVDHDNSHGVTFDAVYRDNVLMTSESGAWAAFPRIYLEASPGRFEHVASLFTSDSASSIDLSGRTVVSVVRDPYATRWDVEVFTLPAQLRAPASIVNDFEDRNASDFESRSGLFQLATRGSNDVLAQSNASGLAVSLATQSDWTDYQRVEADIVQRYGDAGSWVGLVARYTDANNYYYAAIRPDETFGVYKRVNGVETLLFAGTYHRPEFTGAALVVDGSELSLQVGNAFFPVGTDRSLPRGRAGLATWRARADFDDVHVASTGVYGLLIRDWGPWGNDWEVDLTTVGGNWQVPYQEAEEEEGDGYKLGLKQLDMSGDARAYIGTPVANVDIVTTVRLDAFGAGPQSAWFGLLARYVDARNFYYVTVRRTGQIDIRKQVNGVVTVLASASFTPVTGRYHELQFRVINDQLQVFVDRTLKASAHDTAIARGKYGLATYRATATWETLSVLQP
jgi:hypothetical protein